MAHNKIVTIEEGTLTHLAQLRNFDISYNKLEDFPWVDLQNLTSLEMLKMNHNEMVSVPKDAFSNLKNLRSLRLNNNKLSMIAEGTFDGLISLSHLQIYNNPYTCTCSMDWLRDWIFKTTISVPEQNSLICEAPEQLKGNTIVNLPESKCMEPNVTITFHSSFENTMLYEGTELILECVSVGNPKPVISWKIDTNSQKEELHYLSEEEESAETSVPAKQTRYPFKIFQNGTLVISNVRKTDSGNYSCTATNEFGNSTDLMSVEVMAALRPKPTIKAIETPNIAETYPSTVQPLPKVSIFDNFLMPNSERKYVTSSIPTFPPPVEVYDKYIKQTPRYPSQASKCGLNSNTLYVSNHAFNGSLDDVKQYSFNFGVIALGVSETMAKVRLNPLLIPKNSTSSPSKAFHIINKETHNNLHINSLYLCITDDNKHSAVQWSRIEEGINTYVFTGLRPATNYSLCLTYRGEDCEVQVFFATRRRVPNLLIIISVSICLLTVSTVPLLGATCFHLVYKYRGKTYKLIMKAKDQYHVERNLASNFNIRAPYAESQRNINSSELYEGEGDLESVVREKEGDVEGSVVTESFTLSQYRGNLDDCEIGSEYSDRLPLGAEAVNIISNYKYPSQ
ncbi:immunoglobulin superfamily containing leucine-rich repeat protein 2-like [Aplochiton taeniatus]